MSMTNKETANLILWLRRKGLTEEEINDLIAFIATHDPTEAEVKASKEQ